MGWQAGKDIQVAFLWFLQLGYNTQMFLASLFLPSLGLKYFIIDFW